MTELTNIVAEPRRLEIVHPASQEPVGLVLILLPDSHPQVKGLPARQSMTGSTTAARWAPSRSKPAASECFAHRSVDGSGKGS